MKNIEFKYNPYTIVTTIFVDGELPSEDSRLCIPDGQRLQEWADELADILKDEFYGEKFEFEFTGLETDFEYLKSVLDDREEQIIKSYIHKPVKRIEEVEIEIGNIFNEICSGPIELLRDPAIVADFDRALKSEFSVNVVATMSSGKSTLINALLGKKLMPAANEATTATIVKITDNDGEGFKATAFDKIGGKIMAQSNNTCLQELKEFNSNPQVSYIEIEGDIPFVSATGMKLALMDTPGSNNSKDLSHGNITQKMLENSDNSLVLYVINSGQFESKDVEDNLTTICEIMKNNNKQSRDRFIFVANRMDEYKKDESIVSVLDKIKQDLNERGIENPNIFPITAGVALEHRIGDEDEYDLFDSFKRKVGKFEQFHFEKYSQFSNLPKSAQRIIDEKFEKADDEQLVELHTGIVSIEQAIAQYINTYARPIKIINLVNSFNSKLVELAYFAQIEAELRNDINKREELEKNIEAIEINIKIAKQTKEYSSEINQLDLISGPQAAIVDLFDGCIENVKSNSFGNEQYSPERAEQLLIDIDEKCNAISIEIQNKANHILRKSRKHNTAVVINEYKQKLRKLDLVVNHDALSLKPLVIAESSLNNISNIIASNTQIGIHTEYIEEEVERFSGARAVGAAAAVATAVMLPFFSPIIVGGIAFSKVFKKEKQQVAVKTEVDVVNFKDAAEEYICNYISELQKAKRMFVMHIEDETNKLKNYLGLELDKIDTLIIEKMETLKKIKSDTELTYQEIEKKETDLRWLKIIQQRVTETIEF